MTARLESRVARLEQRSGPWWRAWAGVPLSQWSDDALEALIRDETGKAFGALTDEDLRMLLDAAEAGAGAEAAAGAGG